MHNYDVGEIRQKRNRMSLKYVGSELNKCKIIGRFVHTTH